MLEKRDDSARWSRLFYFMALGLVQEAQMNPYCLSCGEELDEGDDGICPRCGEDGDEDEDTAYDDDEEYE